MYKLCKFLFFAAAAIFLFTEAQAQTTDENKEKNSAVSQKVSFYNRRGINIAADFYLPKAGKQGKKLPAVVIGGPLGSVKEQTSGLYAKTLAERGFATLAFDSSFMGESGGQPKYSVSPEIFVEDFRAAVDFLSNRPEVDEKNIGVIGISSGGAWALAAAVADMRMKAIITINMYDLGRQFRQGADGNKDKEELQNNLEEYSNARIAELDGNKGQTVGFVPEKITAQTSDADKSFYAYYHTERGSHPRAHPDIYLSDIPALIAYNPTAQVDLISPRPILFIVGEKAHTRNFSEDAFLVAEDPKELYSVSGADHVDLYDRKDLIPFDAIEKFFENTLVEQKEQNGDKK